jgi:hypothetical protein
MKPPRINYLRLAIDFFAIFYPYTKVKGRSQYSWLDDWQIIQDAKSAEKRKTTTSYLS